MKKKILINEIVKFNLKYKLFNDGVKADELKSIIEIWLEKIEHVESLINLIIVKTNQAQSIDKKKLKTIRLELEKIRIDLEYKN